MDMDKCVGIVTLEDFLNYGNRLQNYALTRLLEEEGFRIVNGIQVYTRESYVLASNRALERCIKRIIPYFVIKGRHVPQTEKLDSLQVERERKFKEYVNSYTVLIPPVVERNYKKAMRTLAQYEIDLYITGSDQVWNPYIAGQAHEFLTFAPKEKRLSFAASIGVNEIPSGKKAQFKKYFNNMKYLSVREQRAVEIIKELTGRDADLTLDPTLLLETKKWHETVKKPDFELASNYVCTYFLGEIPEAVVLFAREKELEIYSLNDKNVPELYVLNPGEFLYMIGHADYVLTDSFHAVAFSIKFHKEFYVFDRMQKGRARMFSRIETITERFGLENRIQNRDRIVEQAPISNWNEIEDELMAEKKNSMDKLLEAIGI